MITWQEMNEYQKHDLLKKKIDTYGDDALLCREEAMFYLRVTKDGFNALRKFLPGIPNPKRVYYQLSDLKIYKEQSKIRREVPCPGKVGSLRKAAVRHFGSMISPLKGGGELEAVLGLRMSS